MAAISVILCTHNPRCDYLLRVLRALDEQTLPKNMWELVVVDNASRETLAQTYDLSWHPHARHVHENTLGLTSARLRGIAETDGALLVFLDDDNVLASDFLEEASNIYRWYPYLGVFGAGRLVPEFEVEPPVELRPRLSLLTLRTVSSAQWSNNATDHESTPWGAGLCVIRPIAEMYPSFVQKLQPAIVGRRGQQLFSHDDDLFSWVATSAGFGFGVFPQLHVTHLIPANRLTRPYLLRLLGDHAFSGSILAYLVTGTQPRRIEWIDRVRLILHGIRRGSFSMRCQGAELRGENRAAAFILNRQLKPVTENHPIGFRSLPNDSRLLGSHRI